MRMRVVIYRPRCRRFVSEYGPNFLLVTRGRWLKYAANEAGEAG